jgi:citrate lyase subunit beta/citryl-CoA lyase
MSNNDPAASGHAVPRSYLYVPGDAGERLVRSHTRGADALIADLEDSVAPGRKSEARAQVARWLAEPSATPSGHATQGLPGPPEKWVRLNEGDDATVDLKAIFGPALNGVVLPKVSQVSDIERIADTLTRLERSHRWVPPPVRIMPLIETAMGLENARAIASAPRVFCLQPGELDLAAALGLAPGDDELELLMARAAIVTASAAAGLAPPVGAVNPRIDNLAALKTSTLRLRRLGFVGRAAIHPRQIPVIHAVFTPSPADVDRARRALAEFDAARAAGHGVWQDADGRMVDEAVIRHSRRTLALARSESARESDGVEADE